MTRAVQRRFGSGECALIEQDLFRRTVLREGDVNGALNIELMEQASLTCLKRGLVVIIEGILNAKRYGAMLERLSRAYPAASLFYAYDLSFEETAIRHVTREKSVSFGTDDMKEWYVISHSIVYNLTQDFAYRISHGIVGSHWASSPKCESILHGPKVPRWSRSRPT